MNGNRARRVAPQLRAESARLRALLAEAVAVLEQVAVAGDDFREGFGPEWEGDPLDDACRAARALAARLHEDTP